MIEALPPARSCAGFGKGLGPHVAGHDFYHADHKAAEWQRGDKNIGSAERKRHDPDLAGSDGDGGGGVVGVGCGGRIGGRMIWDEFVCLAMHDSYVLPD